MKYKVADMKLAHQGKLKMVLAEKQMPVLAHIIQDFAKRQPLNGMTIAACLHVTKETAVLMKALAIGGAHVALCGSNPLSTQNDVAAALAESGIHVFAWRGVGAERYYWCLDKVLDFEPHLTIDDGADLISLIHKKKKKLLKKVLAGQEETTTGVMRLRAMAKEGKLKYPVVAINDTPTKRMFDNYYGTGQSAIDGLLRATNILLAGKIVVVAGYGYCGSGIAKAAKGFGARVIVTEVSPLLALKATMDGFEVMPIMKAVRMSEVFITATGNKDIITREHIRLMRDGSILGNAGHFNVEIRVEDLERLAVAKKTVRENLAEYTLQDNKKLYLIGEGRLMNLAAAEGHPSAVMDMSFANQALTAEWLVQNHQTLKPQVYEVPQSIDVRVAKMKLDCMGVKIDVLTPAQEKYLSGWQKGT